MIIDSFGMNLLTSEKWLLSLVARSFCNAKRYIYFCWIFSLTFDDYYAWRSFYFSKSGFYKQLFGVAFDALGADIDVGTCLSNPSPWYLFSIICASRISWTLDFSVIICYRNKLVLFKSDLRVLTLVSNCVLEPWRSSFFFKTESP